MHVLLIAGISLMVGIIVMIATLKAKSSEI